MTRYDRVADLPLVVESTTRTRHRSETTSGFERVTTEICLAGQGVTGHGEDVTYEADDHEALAEAPGFDDPAGPFDLTGEYTLDEFSHRLDDLNLFATPPARPGSRHYRRWALESAALDLALRQNETDLGAVLEESLDPVRFVVSTRLGETAEGEPPSTDRLHALLERDPTLEFKLDPTPAWTPDLVTELAATDRVRVLDLKGWYEGTDVDVPSDRDLYVRIFEGFDDAIIEDAALEEDVLDLVTSNAPRVSFDYPITGVSDVQDLPFEPGWINIKPSRFGTIESLFETIAYCNAEGIQLYGGGQFELAVGRSQIQTLASLFYADSPNDVAPGVFNRPVYEGEYPKSPLGLQAGPGFGWR